MNILAIDYGTRNIGLAWMQEGLDIVLPYGNIDAKNGVVEVVKLIQEEGIHTVVIGLPLTLDEGTENANTKRVRTFAEELKKQIQIPVHFVDETLSSQAADEMFGMDGGADVSASRDERAAMQILHTYKEQGVVH